ncbi:MAG TPA: S8/S53 family peptidase, partial [Pilimelia sp.]|nr:S8/S53 family peptidase [Pilimelia sp.]
RPQIVVATPHLSLVKKELAERGIKSDDVESEALGLTLMTLENLAEGARRLRENAYLVQYADAVLSARGTWPTGDRLGDDLDLVMFDLRSSFQRRYHGWTPTMGKNRFVTGAQGLGEIGGGGTIPGPGGDDVRPLGEIGGGGEQGLDTLPDGTTFTLPESSEGRGVTIAVFDTKIYPHAGLERHREQNPGAFFDPTTELPEPIESAMAGHGTFGVSRILRHAPGVTLLLRPVLDKFGRGEAWNVANEMVRAVKEAKVDIVHLPLGCVTADGEAPLVFARAVELIALHTVVVAAAGNYAVEGQSAAAGALQSHTPVWPAALPDVRSVAATDEKGNLAPFSRQEPWLRERARGVKVPGLYLVGAVALPSRDDDGCQTGHYTKKFDGTAQWQGTSFAAADFTGELAAARSAR